MNNIKFKDLPKNELPRERFIKYGVESLSNEELLSIILKTGTKNIPVNVVSLEILSSIKDITKLKDMKINNLTNIKGVGRVKAITLLASIELGRRIYNSNNNLKRYRLTENEIFDFLDGCCEIATDDKSLTILYNYLFSFSSYDYEKPHTEALCKRSLLGLTTIYKNMHFPYEQYLTDLISTIKKLLLLRSQNEYVENIIKYNKNNSPLLFQTISDQLIIIIKIYIIRIFLPVVIIA